MDGRVKGKILECRLKNIGAGGVHAEEFMGVGGSRRYGSNGE